MNILYIERVYLNIEIYEYFVYRVYLKEKIIFLFRICLMVCVGKINMFIYYIYGNKKLRWNIDEINFCVYFVRNF